ncbi:ATPase family protein associated with various cellular activities (AAA) [Kordia periserrulae]|uniref:ATPase family protein associated with various cellular activities (AAA) n=1 Tax=Kordia periserrulae TaxID=701523 RepID=A0A2T6C480_9FLAO|nr:ATP-binding protein [Kordia periserrulae]PTX63139.1 ATPase family protein associated with various cellular activities (AAA) [Kordia periserrulae]
MTTELIDYIKQAVRFRLAEVSGSDETIDFPTFDFANDDSEFSKFVTENNFQIYEILILLLAMLPYIAPGFLTSILSEYFPEGSDFPEFGGVKGKQYRGILPTGETAIFIVVGTNYRARNFIISIFNEEHAFAKKSILRLSDVPEGEPKISGTLLLDFEYVELFVYGSISKPKLSQNFPAELLETQLEWDDLVLNEKTLKEVNNVLVWMEHNNTLLNDFNMVDKIKPGYKVMFFGAPGVGKTLTASLMGKHTGKDVYRIDLSLVISKYIGETEKNLSNLFNKAKNKDWILFFDEADAIFGKRTGVRDAHDKYANQEVSYLLQRIESHSGLVILASNYRSNIDKAFTRRFQSIIDFESPGIPERLELWQKYIPEAFMSEEINLQELSETYEVTGANIVNIVQYACLQVLAEGGTQLTNEILENAIRREFIKEGRMV